MLNTLLHLTRALCGRLEDRMQCTACGFWYDPDYGHSCTPC